MEQFIKYVGLDVHGKTMAAAVADSRSSEVRFIGQMANTPEAMVKLVNQVKSKGAVLSFCYEAGPCGYVIHRQLTSLAHRRRPHSLSASGSRNLTSQSRPFASLTGTAQKRAVPYLQR